MRISYQSRLFLENARNDQWRANILFQLAESVGDEVDSLAGYIDMLLAIDRDEMSASEHEKYLGWFAELGKLERGRVRSDRQPGAAACSVIGFVAL